MGAASCEARRSSGQAEKPFRPRWTLEDELTPEAQAPSGAPAISFTAGLACVAFALCAWLALCRGERRPKKLQDKCAV